MMKRVEFVLNWTTENLMKRVVLNGLAVMVVTLAVSVWAGAQAQSAGTQTQSAAGQTTQSAGAQAQSDAPSLGDYARAQKKSKAQAAKPASTVYDNDNLPSATSISVVGGAAAGDAGAATKTDANAAQPQNQDDASKVKVGQSAQDRQKTYDSWKQKIDAQKEKIDQLNHDLDEAKNHPASTTTVPVWPYNQSYQTDVTEKQKALDAAKAELDQMQDDAHKEGVPNSVAQ